MLGGCREIKNSIKELIVQRVWEPLSQNMNEWEPSKFIISKYGYQALQPVFFFLKFTIFLVSSTCFYHKLTVYQALPYNLFLL